MKNFETLADFEAKFGTEEQCLRFLTKLRWPDGYRCPRCQHDEAWLLNEKKYKCKKCKYQTTVTAGTLFQDTHLPLTDWFRAVWYVSSNSEKATVAGLQKELGLGSYNSALFILKKIRFANSLCDSLKMLEGEVEVDRYFCPVISCYLWIAVEIRGKKIRFIQASLQDKPIQFIKDNVKPGSTLWIRGWNEIQKLDKDYVRKCNTYNYSCPYAKTVHTRLESYLAKKEKKVCSKDLFESIGKNYSPG